MIRCTTVGIFWTVALAGHAVLGQFIAPPPPHEIPRIIGLLAHSDNRVRRESVRALYAAGPDGIAALPVLTIMANDRDPDLRCLVAAAVAKVAPNDERTASILIRLASDSNESVQAAAVRALRDLGPSGLRAVPILVSKVSGNRIHDGTSASISIEALGAIGPGAKNAVPVLVRLLTDRTQTAFTRCKAADSLGKIGPNAQESIPALVGSLLNKQVDSFDSEHRQQLVIDGRTMGDETVYLRFLSARALGRIGPAASIAVPSLIGALADGASVPVSAKVEVEVGSMIEDVVWTVRAAAAKAIGEIGLSAAPAKTHLARILEEDSSGGAFADDIDSLCFAGALALLDPESEQARREVVVGLTSTSPYIRGEAATLLGKLGVHDHFIIDALEKAKGDECKHVRTRAIAALRTLGIGVHSHD